jgi:putative SOS response-associated peptidase YedK
MCDRFGFFELKYFLDKLRQLELPFEKSQAFHFNANYNVAPETDIVALLGTHDSATLSLAHWGLIPHWAKELPKVSPINARAESLVVKPFIALYQ